jgi:hypothetical protein
MPKIVEKLTVAAIEEAIRKGQTGTLKDGHGLFLQLTEGVSGNINASWFLRARGRKPGLGAYPAVSLSEARKKAKEERGKLSDPNYDPVAVRQADRAQRKEKRQAERATKADRGRTLEWCAERFIGTQKEYWKGKYTATNRQAWIRNHVPAKIKAMHVNDVDEEHIVKIMQGLKGTPPQKPKYETAWDVLSLLKQVFDFAASNTNKWRDHDLPNPAEWRRLQHEPALRWMKNPEAHVESHAAMRWQDVPAFYQLLIEKDTMSARALRLQILTALRPHNPLEVLHREIGNRRKAPCDTEIWTIPAEKMKVKRREGKAEPHDVYLSTAALHLINEEMRFEPVVLNGIDSRQNRAWRGDKMLLTDEQCEEIRNFPPETTDTAIGKIYGCTSHHVMMIRRGLRRAPRQLAKIPRPEPKANDYFFPASRTYNGVTPHLARNMPLRVLQAILVSHPFKSEDGRKPEAHGFRGTFQTWAFEQTTFKNEVIRACLAHGKIFVGKEQRMTGVYFHGTFEEDRAALMQMWGSYVTTGKVDVDTWHDYLTPSARGKKPAKVIAMPKRRAG